MIHSQGVSEQLDKLYQEYKRIAADAYALVREMGGDAELLRDVNLLTAYDSGTVCYVVEGYLKLLRNDREIRMFSSGDFVPPTGAWHEEYRIVSDFKSDLRCFSHRALLDAAGQRPEIQNIWTQLCQAEQRLHLYLCGEFAPEVLQFEMIVKNFARGEVIVSPDDASRAVYEMISGAAEVIIDDVVVGTVGNSELFGELEFLAPESRRVTIIATKKCFVRILEPHVFSHLIENNSQFAVTLLHNLARRIDQLHSTVLAKNQKTVP